MLWKPSSKLETPCQEQSCDIPLEMVTNGSDHGIVLLSEHSNIVIICVGGLLTFYIFTAHCIEPCLGHDSKDNYKLFIANVTRIRVLFLTMCVKFK